MTTYTEVEKEYVKKQSLGHISLNVLQKEVIVQLHVDAVLDHWYVSKQVKVGTKYVKDPTFEPRPSWHESGQDCRSGPCCDDLR